MHDISFDDRKGSGAEWDRNVTTFGHRPKLPTPLAGFRKDPESTNVHSEYVTSEGTTIIVLGSNQSVREHIEFYLRHRAQIDGGF